MDELRKELKKAAREDRAELKELKKQVKEEAREVKKALKETADDTISAHKMEKHIRREKTLLRSITRRTWPISKRLLRLRRDY